MQDAPPIIDSESEEEKKDEFVLCCEEPQPRELNPAPLPVKDIEPPPPFLSAILSHMEPMSRFSSGLS